MKLKKEGMTKEEATDFLEWFKHEKDTDNFLSRFKSHIPLPVRNPELWDKATKAKIILGKHEFQRPYKQLLKVYPYLTKEKYNQQRIKKGIV